MNTAADLQLEKPVTDSSVWMLDPAVVFLNHGSFGSCPRAVLAVQTRIREELELQPVKFLVRIYEERWDSARRAMAEFVGADEDDLVFVPNATSGINTVLRSLRFQPGDELLVTDHEYNACRNALDFVAERSGASVVVANIPFPLRDSEQIVQTILAKVTPRTRLLLIDHVTSQTGIIMPIQNLVEELDQRGVDVLVDGAHAAGMIPLNLNALGAAYYTGNCHKWLCGPKGAAFLCVRRDRQESVRPLTISHGANSKRTDRSRFLIEFGWMGTADPSAILSLPEALSYVGALCPGGWPEIRERNRRLALAARLIVAEALQVELPCPDALIGAMGALPLPDRRGANSARAPLFLDPLQDWLMDHAAIEIPIMPWPASPKRLIRFSSQLYNSLPQYRVLAAALPKALAVC